MAQRYLMMRALKSFRLGEDSDVNDAHAAYRGKYRHFHGQCFGDDFELFGKSLNPLGHYPWTTELVLRALFCIF